MKFICAADLHLRPDKPPCRRESDEEWIETQLSKLKQILDAAALEKSIVLFAGDICHRASGWPSWFYIQVIKLLKKSLVATYCVSGQHDQPYHQTNFLHKSNFGVLLAANALQITQNSNERVDFFHWGEDISPTKNSTICVTHQMIIEGESSEVFPGQLASSKAQTAHALLKRYPQYQLIVSGDNHKPFAVEYKGRWLVNPGSMTRQRTNETHEPGFYICHDFKHIERITFSYKKDNLITDAKERGVFSNVWTGNSEAVKEVLYEMKDMEHLNYRSALEGYFVKNKTRSAVQRKILGES